MLSIMQIYIGADHAGFELKEKLKKFLVDSGYSVEDKGAFELDINDDYPDFVRPVAAAVAGGADARGIILGGSGFGEATCANRTPGVRALVFYGPMYPRTNVDAAGRESTDPYELVRLARMHNDANILSLGVRFITEKEAQTAVQTFLQTEFPGEERHIRRIKKLG